MDNSTLITAGGLGHAPEKVLQAWGSQRIVTYFCLLLPAYLILVSLLRFRHARWLHQKYHYPTRESFSRMTDNDACEIQKILVQLEFPFFYLKSLQFALFRV